MKELKGSVLTFNWIMTNVIAYVILGSGLALIPWILLNITFGIFLFKLFTTPEDGESNSWSWGPFVGSICFPLTAMIGNTGSYRSIIGLVITLAGFSLVGWSSDALGEEWRDTPLVTDNGQKGSATEEGTALLSSDAPPEGRRVVQDGPYSKIRHPLYAGLITEIVGAWVSGQSWVGLVALVLATAAYIVQLNQEEVKLLARFGVEYEMYQKGTHKLVPFLY